MTLVVWVCLVRNIHSNTVTLGESAHLSPVYIFFLYYLCPLTAAVLAGVALLDDGAFLLLEHPHVVAVPAPRTPLFDPPSDGHYRATRSGVAGILDSR